MSDTANRQVLAQYLQHARALWDDTGELPSADELRALAVELQMTEADSDACDERALELTRQAQAALEGGDGEHAESLLRDAVLLSPIRLQPHYLLAQLYADRHGDGGQLEDRQRALAFAERAQELSPTHEPTRTLIEKMGDIPQAGLSWKKAALIVIVIVTISGSLQLCHRYLVAPEVTDEQLEEVREYLDEHGDNRR